MVEQIEYKRVAFMIPRHNIKVVTYETGARFSKVPETFPATKLFLVNLYLKQGGVYA